MQVRHLCHVRCCVNPDHLEEGTAWENAQDSIRAKWMTSGNFHSLPIDSITVNRDERQRKDLSDIDVLADSISRLGLIHPIVITRESVLVAGERRLTAVRSLGHTHISCQYVDEISATMLHAIELEENIKRKDLSWQEECKSVLEYYELRKQENPEVSQEETARSLGISPGHFSMRMKVANEIRNGNEMVATAPKFSTARGIIQRSEERRAEQDLIQLRKVITPKFEAPPDSIINSDFRKWAATYTGPKFNFVHCDFPYGIGADKFNQGAAPTHGGYDDSEQTYWDLCQCLINSLDQLCTDSCHFMFWFSMHFYHDTLELFNSLSDIRFDPFPLVWVKSDNVGILPDPQRGPRRIYETALFGSRGDRKIVRPTSNAVYLPSDRSQHMSIKPVPVLQQFFRMFVDETTLMLDPTCGSGSSLRAAEGAGARHVVGIEANTEFAEGANRALRTFRLGRMGDGKDRDTSVDDPPVVGEGASGVHGGLDAIIETLGEGESL